MPIFGRLAAFLFRRQDGVSAVEFALAAPVFFLILAATADLGIVLYARFEINAAVSAGTGYVLSHASMVNSGDGSQLAEDITRLNAHTETMGQSSAKAVVNNGPSATLSGSTIAMDGRSSNADVCYCPQGDASELDWGAAVSCGADCPDEGSAGKFVTVSVFRTHEPLFSGYGFVADNGIISASALVQVQ